MKNFWLRYLLSFSVSPVIQLIKVIFILKWWAVI